MDNMEEKLNSILGNPQLMQQIMSMAQSFSQYQSEPPRQETHEVTTTPEIDPAMLGKIMSFAGKTGPDKDQQALLKALGPYLTTQRIQKLEKAMRAAKLANLASSFLGTNLTAGR